MAGTVLTNVIQGLSTFTPKSEKALNEMGLTTADVDLRFNSLESSLTKLMKANMNADQSFAIFNKRGKLISTVLSEMKQKTTETTTGFSKMKDEVLGMGSVDSFFNKSINTTAYSIQETENRITALKNNIAEGLKPSLLSVLSIINGLTDALKGSASAIGFIISTLGVAVPTMVGATVVVFKFKEAIMALKEEAILFGKLGKSSVWILGITAMVTLLVSITSHFQKIKREQDTALRNAKEFAKEYIDNLKGMTEKEFELMKSKGDLTTTLKPLNDALKTNIQTYQEMKKAIDGVIQSTEELGYIEENKVIKKQIEDTKREAKVQADLLKNYINNNKERQAIVNNASKSLEENEKAKKIFGSTTTKESDEEKRQKSIIAKNKIEIDKNNIEIKNLEITLGALDKKISILNSKYELNEKKKEFKSKEALRIKEIESTLPSLTSKGLSAVELEIETAKEKAGRGRVANEDVLYEYINLLKKKESLFGTGGVNNLENIQTFDESTFLGATIEGILNKIKGTAESERYMQLFDFALKGGVDSEQIGEKAKALNLTANTSINTEIVEAVKGIKETLVKQTANNDKFAESLDSVTKYIDTIPLMNITGEEKDKLYIKAFEAIGITGVKSDKQIDEIRRLLGNRGTPEAKRELAKKVVYGKEREIKIQAGKALEGNVPSSEGASAFDIGTGINDLMQVYENFINSEKERLTNKYSKIINLDQTDGLTLEEKATKIRNLVSKDLEEFIKNNNLHSLIVNFDEYIRNVIDKGFNDESSLKNLKEELLKIKDTEFFKLLEKSNDSRAVIINDILKQIQSVPEEKLGIGKENVAKAINSIKVDLESKYQGISTGVSEGYVTGVKKERIQKGTLSDISQNELKNITEKNQFDILNNIKNSITEYVKKLGYSPDQYDQEMKEVIDEASGVIIEYINTNTKKKIDNIKEDNIQKSHETLVVDNAEAKRDEYTKAINEFDMEGKKKYYADIRDKEIKSASTTPEQIEGINKTYEENIKELETILQNLKKKRKKAEEDYIQSLTDSLKTVLSAVEDLSNQFSDVFGENGVSGFISSLGQAIGEVENAISNSQKMTKALTTANVFKDAKTETIDGIETTTSAGASALGKANIYVAIALEVTKIIKGVLTKIYSADKINKQIDGVMGSLDDINKNVDKIYKELQNSKTISTTTSAVSGMGVGIGQLEEKYTQLEDLEKKADKKAKEAGEWGFVNRWFGLDKDAKKAAKKAQEAQEEIERVIESVRENITNSIKSLIEGFGLSFSNAVNSLIKDYENSVSNSKVEVTNSFGNLITEVFTNIEKFYSPMTLRLEVLLNNAVENFKDSIKNVTDENIIRDAITTYQNESVDAIKEFYLLAKKQNTDFWDVVRGKIKETLSDVKGKEVSEATVDYYMYSGDLDKTLHSSINPDVADENKLKKQVEKYTKLNDELSKQMTTGMSKEEIANYIGYYNNIKDELKKAEEDLNNYYAKNSNNYVDIYNNMLSTLNDLRKDGTITDEVYFNTKNELATKYYTNEAKLSRRNSDLSLELLNAEVNGLEQKYILAQSTNKEEVQSLAVELQDAKDALYARQEAIKNSAEYLEFIQTYSGNYQKNLYDTKDVEEQIDDILNKRVAYDEEKLNTLKAQNIELETQRKEIYKNMELTRQDINNTKNLISDGTKKIQQIEQLKTKIAEANSKGDIESSIQATKELVDLLMQDTLAIKNTLQNSISSGIKEGINSTGKLDLTKLKETIGNTVFDTVLNSLTNALIESSGLQNMMNNFAMNWQNMTVGELGSQVDDITAYIETSLNKVSPFIEALFNRFKKGNNPVIFFTETSMKSLSTQVDTISETTETAENKISDFNDTIKENMDYVNEIITKLNNLSFNDEFMSQLDVLKTLSEVKTKATLQIDLVVTATADTATLSSLSKTALETIATRTKDLIIDWGGAR